MNQKLQTACIEFRFPEIPLAVGLARESFEFRIRNGLHSMPDTEIERIRVLLLRVRNRLLKTVQEESARTKRDFDLEMDALISYLDSLRENATRPSEYVPRGVCAVIASSIWPIFHSTQFILANLLVGNEVILKPSERVSRIVLEWVRELRSLGGSLESVQVLVGDQETGRRLACNDGVDVIIFQGGYETGMRIRQDTLASPSKELLLFLGSKNPIVLNKPITEEICGTILENAFLGAGQHCLSTPLLFVQARHFNDALEGLSKALRSSSGTDEGGANWIGVLQDQARVERYLKFINVLEREGARFELKGNRDSSRTHSCFSTPTLAAFREIRPGQMRKMESFQTEVLGPHLTMVSYADFDELLGLFDDLTYGLACSFFGNPSSPEQLVLAQKVGLVTLGASLFELDPWKGAIARKRSGNHGRLGHRLLGQLALECAEK
ncbi:MAG: aldehyde dehydrogenase family protein [Bdellovibrionales bacterium]|nr:aldehyde dehydrogenase family protein [Bdellovibrionales bacterium]